MRGSRRSEEQIIGVLKQAEKGMATAELCRQEGIFHDAESQGAAVLRRAWNPACCTHFPTDAVFFMARPGH